MARAPETDFPEEIDSDREIKPLATNGARVPTGFIIAAAVAGLLVLILLQVFGGNDRQRTVAERPTFTPPIDTTGLSDRPLFQPPPEPAPVIIEDEDEDDDDFNNMNMLELERLRQLALLEEQRLKLEQARDAAQAAERSRRMKSSIVLVDRGGTAPTESDGLDRFTETIGAEGFGGFGGEPDPNERNEIITNSSERFLRDASVEDVVKVSAVKLQNQDSLLTQGTFISGITETMINSDLPGLIRAIVDKPVYSRTGKRVLIPKGSRLIGKYQSGVAVGQSRVYIVWTRLERPDGVVISLGSPGAGPLGQSGMAGDVDTHFFERFGAATLFSALGPAMSALLDNGNRSANTQEIIQGGQQGFERAAEITLRQSINIPPTIRVPQGSEITIFVNRDLSFHDL